MLQKANNSTVSGKRSSWLPYKAGFTIIEVMIVMAIVGLIILIVLLALPALQRQSRNSQRDHSAQLIAAAVKECVTNNDGNIDACKTPASLGLTQKELGIFTGVHYGSVEGCTPTDAFGSNCFNIPTEDEPNWLFGLECKGDWFRPINETSKQSFVVTYKREISWNPLNGNFGTRCIDG